MIYNYWTEEEESTLADLWPEASKEDIIAAIPRHTWRAIGSRARKRGIRRLGKSRNRTQVLRKELNDTEWAYLAGMTDADGYISLRRTCRKVSGEEYVFYTPTMGITNRSAELMKWLDERINWSLAKYEKGTGYSTNMIYRRVLASHDAYVLLDGMLPYLHVKRQRAALVAEFCKMRRNKYLGKPYGEEEHRFYREVWKLNHGTYPTNG